MSAQHTPGPLTVRENGDANSYAMLTADHKWLAVNLLHNGEVMVQQQRENMRRLATCWNACEQMSTASIEELVTLGGVPALIVYGDELRRERNEMLAALKEAIEREHNPFEPNNQSDRHKRWSALVAKVTRGSR